jgi:RimJ/RimL family protein N-acetyltransferase
MTFPIEQLVWDSDFWGIKTAKATIHSDTIRLLPTLENQLISNDIALAYLFIEPQYQEAFQKIPLSSKSLLTDKRLIYHYIPKQSYHTSPNRLQTNGIEICQKIDDNLLTIASQAAVVSRFTKDKQIPFQKVEELYQLFIINAVNNKQQTLLILREGEVVVGLLLVELNKSNDTTVGNFVLASVHENYRGKGYGSTLISSGIDFLAHSGATLITSVTQEENKKSRFVHESCGFQLNKRLVVYHWRR